MSALFNYFSPCENCGISNLPAAYMPASYPTASAPYAAGCCKNKDVGIFNQSTAEASVAANAPLLIGSNGVQGGAVSYNAQSGIYTANCAGSYLFLWTAEVSGGSVSGETSSVVVTLENGGGGTVYATSGTVATAVGTGVFPAAETLTGFALVRAEAGATFALFNRSGAEITLEEISGSAALPSFAGTVTVVKIA